MNLLYFTLEGFDTPNPNNQLAETMIEYFLNNGIDVDLIQSTRLHINNDIPDRLKNYKSLNVYNLERKVVGKTNFIKRYIEESTFFLKSIKILKKNKKKYDAVYVQSNATIVWTILFFKIFLRKPINYVIYDIFPGQSMSLGVVKNKYLYNIFQLIQKIAYRCSKHIIVLSDDMKKTLVDMKIPQSKIFVIYPWYDENVFRKIEKDKNRLYDDLNLDRNSFYIQYAGSLGQNFDEKFIYELASKISNNNIKILLIGDGVKKEEIKDYIRKKKIKNIILRDRQDLSIINLVYNATDIGIVPLKREVIKNGFPSKVCQLLACGKPIITHSDKSLYTDLINNNNLGYATFNYKYDNLIDEIFKLYNNKEYYSYISNNCLKYAKNNYTSSTNCKKLLNVLVKEV